MQLSRIHRSCLSVCAPLSLTTLLGALSVCLSSFLCSPVHAQTVTEIRPGVKYSGATTPVPPVDERRLIRLEWNVPSGVSVDKLHRSPGFGNLPFVVASGSSYDDYDWDYGTTYIYYLSGTTTGYDPVTQQNVTQQWQSQPVKVTVQKVAASKAQTVDTRIDMRYGTNYKLQDHKFGTGLYRGGLFAGFNADNARVARTYLQFDNLIGPPTTGDKLWALGGVYLYSPRNAKSNVSSSLKARFVPSDTWNPATLVWSNAPAPISSGVDPTPVPWTTGDPGKWVMMNIIPDLENSLVSNGGDGTLSVAIMGANETNGNTPATFPLQASNGWSYFAKAAYVEPGKTDLAPFVFYAYGGMGAGVAGVSINSASSTIHSNESFTGSVGLSSPAPAGGVTVTLSSSDPAKVSVPASVTIPAGQSTATFSATSGTIGASGTVTISATLGNTVTTTVNVAP